MQLEIKKPYSDIIQRLIDYGIAADAQEVIHQSILILSNQIDFEDQYLVNKAVENEVSTIERNNSKTFSLNNVLSSAGIE